MLLDKRFGKFELTIERSGYSAENGFEYESIDVGVREVDFLTETDVFEVFTGTTTRGYMTAKDDKLLEL